MIGNNRDIDLFCKEYSVYIVASSSGSGVRREMFCLFK